MNKRHLFSILAACFCSTAFADTPAPKPEHVSLTAQEAQLLAAGLSALNGAPTAANPKVLIPFSFNGEFTRIALFRDCDALEAATQAAQGTTAKAVQAINLKYHLVWLPTDKDGNSSVDLTKTKTADAVAGTEEIRAALALPFDVLLYKISEDDLNLANNPLPPTIGVELAPILKK